ncbi:cell cycle and apoptosis regulator protein 2 isoform X3 [Phocoena sinus]|uniref:cell cycle and apoptosis regulator protein 2 isoform X3 n=1 Tax=Phocoena sinus TaxID=42100 RepID=UPI0013C4B298|nr:cell cycle and apoptosis regulator protein 2 isoform X3 [Phocoena sinus]
MSQFKRQRINPLPGGRNFSGAASTSLLGPPPGLLTPPVATDLSQNARHLQGGEKQRVFTGIVTSLHDYFGVVDEEVFFQLSVVKGRLPQLGEKVLVKAAYNPGQAVPWNAVKVQTLSNQPLLKSPAPPLLHVAALGQKQGILGAQPQLIFQPHRIPPLFPQKPLSLFQTSHTLHLSHLNRFPARGPHGRLDPGRSDDYDSKKRKQRAGGEPWGAKKPRHDLPPYRVHLTPYTVDSSTCDFLELQRRYRTLLVPADFLAVHLSWLSAFPLSQPFSLHHPSRIQASSEKEPAPDAGAEPTSTDSDPAYSSKVLLLSSPGLEELYRCCMLFVDDMTEPRETPEHPLKQIKFLLGQKEEEVVLVGGEWSPSLDGLDPKGDPQVLVRTAIRCAQAQTGIDLSACTKWWRFAEFQYLQLGPPRRLQTVVVYLPDIWTIMPTLEEWEALCQQKAAEAAPPPQEVAVETEPTEQAADASEQAADTSKQNAENPEVTAQQEMDTDLPEAPPPPLEPAVMARPSCVNLSIHSIVEDRRPKERISFEVMVLAELFLEMLQRDFGYRIYKMLLSLPEKVVAAPEPEKEEAAKEEEAVKEEAKESKDEVQSEGTAAESDAPPKEDGLLPKPPSSGGEEEEKPRGEVSEDLCEMALDPELLLLRDDGEEEFAGAKLEDSEVRSVASNQSEMEFSSLQDMPKELDPSPVLPLDCLLAFVFFDANWCGYLHRRDLERILLTLGLRLSAEQAKQLVSRVVAQNICQYRSLQYSRPEGPDGGLPEEVLFGAYCALRPSGDSGAGCFVPGPSLSLFTALLGNLDLLPPPGKSAKPGAAPVEHKGLVSHNGSLINVGNLLQRAEQQDSGRLYLENKIHTLELKLGEWLLARGPVAAGRRRKEPSGRPAPQPPGLWPYTPLLSLAVFPVFPRQRRAITASQPLK